MTALLHRSRRLVLLLVVATGLSLAVGTSTPASAGKGDSADRQKRNYYGAIALSLGDGAGGIANDRSSKAAAKRGAMATCKRRSSSPGQCEVGVWVKNACGAISVKRSGGGIGGYGWAVRKTKGPAVRAAQHECTKRFGKCRKYGWVCTTRRL